MRGLSVAMKWEDQAIGFPRVSASCDYLRPARFEDVLEITVHILKVGSKSVTYAFDFAKDGEMIARGQVSTVCCRVGEGHELQSIEIPTFLANGCCLRSQRRNCAPKPRRGFTVKNECRPLRERCPGATSR